jgi:hypothetical protein
MSGWKRSAAGYTISICCGPSGDKPFAWSVHVMSKRGEEFDQPFAALSFEHAIQIAFSEITKRGW